MFVFREYDPYALCLVVGPGLEPFVWYATTAKAKVAYWDKQHMLFTTPSDFDRPEGGLGHRERRYDDCGNLDLASRGGNLNSERLDIG